VAAGDDFSLCGHQALRRGLLDGVQELTDIAFSNPAPVSPAPVDQRHYKSRSASLLGIVNFILILFCCTIRNLLPLHHNHALFREFLHQIGRFLGGEFEPRSHCILQRYQSAGPVISSARKIVNGLLEQRLVRCGWAVPTRSWGEIWNL